MGGTEGVFSRQNILLMLAVALGVIIVAVIFSRPWTGTSPLSFTNQSQPAAIAPVSSGSLTRQAAPTGITVPDRGATDVAQDVAVPNTVVPGNISGSASSRSFSITAAKNTFMPDTVIVRQGDTVTLSVTALDRDYDFTQPDFGFHVTVPRGSAKSIRFEATASGKFLFYCVTCGGPTSGPKGNIIIAPK